MNHPDHQQLISRLQEQKDACLVLSGELSSLAVDLQKGELRQLEATEAKVFVLRQQFETLKKDIIAFALPYQAVPDPGEMTSLAALEPLLLVVNQSLKAAAMTILDQVLSIKHRDNDSFEPLMACLFPASDLRQAIAQVPLPALHPAVVALTDGTHPLAGFLTILRERHQMNEEKIAEIQNMIAGTCGNLLFIAALMGKLVIAEQTGKEKTTKPEVSESMNVNASEATVISGETDEVLEQRQILQDLLMMTEMKIHKLIKNELVREEDLASFVAAVKKMGAFLSEKSDFKEDFRQLQVMRAALEDMENRAFNPRKRLERQP